MKIVTVEEMKIIERQADASGLSYSQMMENAGRGMADIAREYLNEKLSSGLVLALIGPGNNGGDALVALAWLAQWGFKVCAYLIRSRENDELITRVLDVGGEVISVQQDLSYSILQTLLLKSNVILDGLLGTGAKLPLRSEYVHLIAYVVNFLQNSSQKPYVIAIDCPSGIDCDSGSVSEQIISADITGTMAAIKQGLFTFPAANYTGRIHVIDIGILDGLSTWDSIQRFVVDAQWVKNCLPPRHANAHKGTFGTVLVCAGSKNFTGAAWLAGQAAYRIGAGLVTLALPEPLYYSLAGQFPEATWLILPDEKGVINEQAAIVLKENFNKATALLLGPGWGLEDCTKKFLSEILPRRKKQSLKDKLPPLIIDADGLKLLAKIDGWKDRMPDETILTPHPGEMSILTEIDKNEININRLAIAEKYSKLWGQVVVLKGAYTVIAEPKGQVALISVATPALARAGTGDVLAGLISGLRAQGVDAFASAVSAAWIHGQAGLFAEKHLGTTASVLASDLLRHVPDVYASLLN